MPVSSFYCKRWQIEAIAQLFTIILNNRSMGVKIDALFWLTPDDMWRTLVSGLTDTLLKEVFSCHDTT